MMILTSEKGAGLLVALMLAHGAPAEAPGDTPEVAEAPPMMIAAGEPEAAEDALEGAFRRLSDAEKERARRLLEAQRISPGSGPAWSLDKIAAAHQAGKPWERIVVELQRKRLVAAGSPADILDGPKAAPRAVVQNKDEELAATIGTAGGPDGERTVTTGGPQGERTVTTGGPEGERTVTTGLSSEISCAVPAGGALTASAPAEAE